MSDASPAATTPSNGRRVIRQLVAAGVVLLTLIGIASWFAFASPVWWKPTISSDAAAAERASHFEQAIIAEFTRVRSDAPEWALRIPSSDLNDWLGTRFPAWLESRGEQNPGAVSLALDHGEFRIGIAKEIAVVWVAANLVPADGGVQVRHPHGGVGRLSIPLPVMNLTSMLQSQPLNRPIPLADGRVVKVQDVEVLPGEIRLRLLTTRP